MGMPDKHKARLPSDGSCFREDWRERHELRLRTAAKNECRVREWCKKNNAELVVFNDGHHWSIYRPPRRPCEEYKQKQWAEWWPSSAKLVFGKQWKNGIHVHEVEQLIVELDIFLNRKKEDVMAVLTGFDANKVEPQKTMTPLPAGDYKAAIVESEMNQNSKKNGSYLKLKFEVLDGEHKGRKLFTNLNLDNPSNVAVEIAKSELSAICRAVSVMTPNDSAELHNKPLVVTVGLEKRKDTGDMQNRVKGYTALGDATKAQPVEAGEAPWK